MARLPEIPRLDRLISELRRRVERLERGSGEVYGVRIVGKAIATAVAGARMVLGPDPYGRDGSTALAGYTGHPEERWPGFLAMDATSTPETPGDEYSRVWLWAPQLTETDPADFETAHLFLTSRSVDDIRGSLGALKADYLWLECQNGLFVQYLPTSAAVANVGRGLDGYLYQSSSSRAIKVDIDDVDLGDAAVLALRARTFRDKRQADKARDRGEVAPLLLGLIAEEVEQTPLGPLLVGRDEQGEPQSVAYDRLGVALLPVIQRLLRRVANLEERA